MNFNPMMLFNMLRGNNPKTFVMNMIKQQMPNNPFMNNLIDMANNGNTKGLEEVARNMLREKGLDYDKEFNNFMSNFKCN